MKVWSRGLGRTELNVDCRYYKVRKDPEGSDNIMIIGTLTDPVNWEFKATIQPEDVPGMMMIFFHWPVIKLVIKNAVKYLIYLFNRDKYEVKGVDVFEKVSKAYDQVMNRAKPKTV